MEKWFYDLHTKKQWDIEFYTSKIQCTNTDDPHPASQIIMLDAKDPADDDGEDTHRYFIHEEFYKEYLSVEGYVNKLFDADKVIVEEDICYLLFFEESRVSEVVIAVSEKFIQTHDNDFSCTFGYNSELQGTMYIRAEICKHRFQDGTSAVFSKGNGNKVLCSICGKIFVPDEKQ